MGIGVEKSGRILCRRWGYVVSLTEQMSKLGMSLGNIGFVELP